MPNIRKRLIEFGKPAQNTNTIDKQFKKQKPNTENTNNNNNNNNLRHRKNPETFNNNLNTPQVVEETVLPDGTIEEQTSSIQPQNMEDESLAQEQRMTKLTEQMLQLNFVS